jgi:predicted house-cleaning NTP pyrophosphatase (Maf/HAM1 superfamily)
VTHIDGSYSNVVGLPVAMVDRLLRSFGDER